MIDLVVVGLPCLVTDVAIDAFVGFVEGSCCSDFACWLGFRCFCMYYCCCSLVLGLVAGIEVLCDMPCYCSALWGGRADVIGSLVTAVIGLVGDKCTASPPTHSKHMVAPP